MENERSQRADAGLASGAVYANSFKSVDLWVQSTGFRTNALRYRTLSHSNDHRLADEFLVNTRYRRDDRESEVSIAGYFSDASVAMLAELGREVANGLVRVGLPKGAALRMRLSDAVSRRRSVRHFTGDAMGFDDLATLVRSAAGVTGRIEARLAGGGTRTLQLRATPSGGGLFPIEFHLAALRVGGLDPGLYRYDPVGDQLYQTGGREELEGLVRCFAVPDDVISVSRACVIALLVAQPWRSMRKYGNRGMRYVFLEAGSMAMTVNLTSTALGLGSVDCASVYDDEANEVMDLDGLFHTLLHTVVIGNPG